MTTSDRDHVGTSGDRRASRARNRLRRPPRWTEVPPSACIWWRVSVECLAQVTEQIHLRALVTDLLEQQATSSRQTPELQDVP